MSIYPFKQNVSYFYDYALACLEDGDYITALDYFQRALKLPKNSLASHTLTMKLHIAEAYNAMDLYDASLREYLRLLRRATYAEDEIYMGITRNLLFMNQMPLAVRFYNQAIEQGYLDPYDGFAPMEFPEASNPEIRLLKNDEDDNVLVIARQMAFSGEESYAQQLLEAIGPQNPQYAVSRGALAALYLLSGDGEKCLKMLDEAAAASSEMADDTIITRISALDFLGRVDERDRCIETLTDTQCDNSEGYTALALCMARVNNNEMAFKFADKALNNAPFDRDLNLICALACSNLGYMQRAKEMLVDLQIIFPEDFVLRFYAQLVWENDAARKIDLNIDLPGDIRREVMETVFGWLTHQTDPLQSDRDLRSDKMLRHYVRYCLFNASVVNQCALAAYLATVPSYQQTIRDCLVDPDLSHVVKKEIVLALLNESHDKRFELFCGDSFKRFNPKLPRKETRIPFKRAYFRAYAALAFVSEAFDKKLNAAFLTVSAALKGKTDEDETAIAALIAYKSCAFPSVMKRTDVSEIFGADKVRFEALLREVKLYDSQLKAAKGKRKIQE